MEQIIIHMKPLFTIVTFGLLLHACLSIDLSGSGSSAKVKSVDLQGHRGARGMRPENTIPAFQYCIEHNMTTIELDTHVTKDKQLIIWHDSVMNSSLCLDEDGKPAQPIPIKELTVAEIKKYDCGAMKNDEFPEQVPVKNTRLVTLSAFFDFIEKYEKDHPEQQPLGFNIETKFGERCSREEILETAELMVKTIETAGMVDRTTVQSFVIDILPEIKKLNSSLKTSALFHPTRFQGLKMQLGLNANRSEIIEKTIKTDADIISPYFLYVTSAFVTECHAKNIKVLPWTVNDEAKIKNLLNLGVDGIISDYPDKLYGVYSQWKEEHK
jgi:glycerophosphoryl diester phosphodiesterase